MIISGAARSIIVKLAYQSGFEAPLTITLLYLLGQSFSLIVYAVQTWHTQSKNNAEKAAHDDQKYIEMDMYPNSHSAEPRVGVSLAEKFNDSFCIENMPSTCIESKLSTVSAVGSVHGLNIQSEQRISWVHHIPYYARPAIPAIFNLVNSALRWASLVYIDASVAEMMISGLELILGVVAARVFRHRLVATSRWMGVIIVAVGVVIIEYANNSKEQSELNEEDVAEDVKEMELHYMMIGVVLIIVQSLLSALQDIAEEIFMQGTNFPATKMLGFEGLYGFVIGLIIYTTVGSQFNIEDIDSTMASLRNNPKLIWWLVGLPILFLITGVFNIKATEVTSAMTRNVWKNFRTVCVWIAALCIHYIGKNPALGEDWHIPESFYILLGFMVMFIGVVVYYFYKDQEKPVQKPVHMFPSLNENSNSALV